MEQKLIADLVYEICDKVADLGNIETENCLIEGKPTKVESSAKHVVYVSDELKQTKILDEKVDGSGSDRVQLQNLPPYYSYKQIKSLLAKKVRGASARKVKCLKNVSFFSFGSVEEASKAITALNGIEIKGYKLIAKFAKPESLRGRDIPRLKENGKERPSTTVTTAREYVTPLADVPYAQQLDKKVDDAKRLIESLTKQLVKANVKNAGRFVTKDLLEPIRPSPRITGYRNKCEFTVGRSIDGNVCVGFVRGRFSDNQHYILPADSCDHISVQMKNIVKCFEQFVVDSNYPPFDEFERVGVWKLLTVREFGSDVMLIATVFPMKSPDEEALLIKRFSETFLRLENFEEKSFRVTSVFWQRLANASDEVNYQHIGGSPYIYGRILDARFRVSPGAFFQTNSFAAEVLYSTIAEKCGLIPVQEKDRNPLQESKIEIVEESQQLFEDRSNLDDEEPEVKRLKSDGSENKKCTVLLDICCGTGTVGICILNAVKHARIKEKCFLFGVELNESAVEDARHNAKDNLFSENECCFVAGKAEDVFRKLPAYLPSFVDLNNTPLVGVLDPPRAGLHDKVILGCRVLSNMRRLIYVSCSPSMASKNLVDLCRPSSKKYAGEPFRIYSITPVDLFPQTNHCEWVVQLDR